MPPADGLLQCQLTQIRPKTESRSRARRHRPSTVVAPATVASPKRHSAELTHRVRTAHHRLRRRYDRLPPLLLPSGTTTRLFWTVCAPQPDPPIDNGLQINLRTQDNVLRAEIRSAASEQRHTARWSARSLRARRSRKNRGHGWHCCDGCRARARRPRVCE